MVIVLSKVCADMQTVRHNKIKAVQKVFIFYSQCLIRIVYKRYGVIEIPLNYLLGKEITLTCRS